MTKTTAKNSLNILETSSRRRFLRQASTAVGAVLAAPMLNSNSFALFADSATSYTKRAIGLVEESLVIDMLSLFDMTKMFTAPATGKNPLEFTREELLSIKKSGIDVFHPAVGIGGPNVHSEVLAYLGGWNGLVAEHPDLVMRIDSIADIEEQRRTGKIGFILGIQNADHFRTVADVKTFYHLGQRVSQLTYNSRNLIGTGSTDRKDGGISDFGVSIIAEMNKLGMAIDVSHCGDQTTLDAFDISSKPVLITHSNVRALAKGHPRCKNDEAIKKMAKSGSVMGITAVRNFVTAAEPTTIEHYVNHIDYVAKLVGIDHVGIGTDADLNGYDDLPAPAYKALKEGYKASYGFREKIDIEGLDHPKKMFDLADALIRRGYSNDNIRAVLGGNFKRVLGDIWTV